METTKGTKKKFDNYGADLVGCIVNDEIIDPATFERSIARLAQDFKGDHLGAILFLIDEDMDEDVAHDLVYKYVDG